jgi:hypothetical protein
MYIFKSPNLIGFCYIYVAYNTTNFTLKIYMFVGYIIDYVWIFISYFSETLNYDFWFFKQHDHRYPEPKELSHKNVIFCVWDNMWAFAFFLHFSLYLSSSVVPNSPTHDSGKILIALLPASDKGSPSPGPPLPCGRASAAHSPTLANGEEQEQLLDNDIQRREPHDSDPDIPHVLARHSHVLASSPTPANRSMNHCCCSRFHALIVRDV